jgi:hypothetical protein
MKDPLQQVQDLTIQQKDNYLTIGQKVASVEILQNKEMLDSLPGAEQLLPEMIKTMGFYMKIKIPHLKYNLIEHSAHKYNEEKHILEWSYSSAKIQEIIKSGKTPSPIYVKLEKKADKAEKEEKGEK